MTTITLRCTKCGSDAGFLIESQDKKVLPIKGKLSLDSIKKTVLVTCTYCNNRWGQAPLSLLKRESRESKHKELREIERRLAVLRRTLAQKKKEGYESAFFSEWQPSVIEMLREEAESEYRASIRALEESITSHEEMLEDRLQQQSRKQ